MWRTRGVAALAGRALYGAWGVGASTQGLWRWASSRAAPLGAELIPLVNKLQEVTASLAEDGGGVGLDLPQLVVIGGQSSGKSSVLESLVGRDFLPRGSGIVTRRPLVLQLSRAEDASSPETARFGHLPGKVFTDFEAVREEIAADTDRVSGTNKGISPAPIVLNITSPHVLPLTLVDTPGIARVPVGDQPRDIEAQIRELVSNYVSKPGAIILAVHPANQDVATSDALQLASEVDPAGYRTIGVLTKVDLMDAGTDALDVMLGRTHPLKLGFVGVVNRSQADVASDKPVDAGLRAEAEFFSSHPKYARVADACGTPYLAQKCSEILSSHIRHRIPKLYEEINELHSKAKAELKAYGETPYRGPEGQRAFVLGVLNTVAKGFVDHVEGHASDVSTHELNGGARIRYVFQHILAESLEEVEVELSTADVRTAIKNAAGTAPSLFVPEAAFELLIRSQIARLREPLLHAADLVHNELLRTLSHVKIPELERFAHLKDASQDVVADLLRSCMVPTQEMLTNLVECELSYINTNHPDFTRGPDLLKDDGYDDDYEEPRGSSGSESGGGSFLWSLFSSSSKDDADKTSGSSSSKVRDTPTVLRVDDSKLSKLERVQVRLIMRLLDSYLEIVKKQLADMGSKTIMHFLVANAKDNVQRALVSNLYKDNMTEELLREDPRIVKHRSALEHRIQVLEHANEILQLADFEIENTRERPYSMGRQASRRQASSPVYTPKRRW